VVEARLVPRRRGGRVRGGPSRGPRRRRSRRAVRGGECVLAAPALGEARLQRAWDDALRAHRLEAAQILLSAPDLAEWASYVNARNALETRLRLRAVPLVKENDATATRSGLPIAKARSWPATRSSSPRPTGRSRQGGRQCRLDGDPRSAARRGGRPPRPARRLRRWNRRRHRRPGDGAVGGGRDQRRVLRQDA
jgi:hypothetical protein